MSLKVWTAWRKAGVLSTVSCAALVISARRMSVKTGMMASMSTMARFSRKNHFLEGLGWEEERVGERESFWLATGLSHPCPFSSLTEQGNN